MREIKFRAWDKLFKEMFDVPMLSNKAVFHAIPPKFMPEGVPLAQVELMQYTGLLDKNGKEIYEGDIVKAGENIVLIIWNKGFASFALAKTGWMYDHFFGEIDNERCEVIGNIHENPELLEGVKP